MSTASSATLVDLRIADARRVNLALKKHIETLRKRGVRESDIRDYEAVIERASLHERVSRVASQQALELSRIACRDQLGDLRRWAGVLADGREASDPAIARAFSLHRPFPKSDRELSGVARALGPALRKYGAKLAAFGVTREAQEALLAGLAQFGKLLKEVRSEKSKARSERLDREASLEELGRWTTFYRRLGLAAFHGQAAEADFRRVAKQPKAKKAEPRLAPVAPPLKAAVG